MVLIQIISTVSLIIGIILYHLSCKKKIAIMETLSLIVTVISGIIIIISIIFNFVISVSKKIYDSENSCIESYSGNYEVVAKDKDILTDILVLESNEDGSRVSVYLPHEQAVQYFEGDVLSCSFSKDRRRWQVNDFTVTRVIPKEKIE